jgi:hypothetical protein
MKRVVVHHVTREVIILVDHCLHEITELHEKSMRVMSISKGEVV